MSIIPLQVQVCQRTHLQAKLCLTCCKTVIKFQPLLLTIIQFRLWWTHIISLFAILCGVVGFLNMRISYMDDLATIGWADVVWPCNPYSMYRFAKHVKANYAAKINPIDPVVVMYFSLTFSLSLFCLVILVPQPSNHSVQCYEQGIMVLEQRVSQQSVSMGKQGSISPNLVSNEREFDN